MPREYNKLPLTTHDTLQYLQGKGLSIGHNEMQEARDLIGNVGLAHLRPYLNQRCIGKDQGNAFVAGTTFGDVAELLRGDAEIRKACWDSLRLFELDFRNQVAEYLSQNFGSHSYDKEDVFKNNNARDDIGDWIGGTSSKN